MVMANVNVIIGDYDTALDYLDEILGMPSVYTSNFIESDPMWAPLRELPRFREIIEKYRGITF
ncbi:MAG TPA: hypothetical protein VLB27_09570 [candidate division Zixibacteria bacterium]|nr:hypothetical protein [candidate division Zixibacteria bacterium]